MDWQNKVISPKRGAPPKVDIRYPCPGLFRFAGFVSFLFVGLGAYYGGMEMLGLEQLDWAAPDWTAKHVGVVAASVIVGMLAGLIGAASAMTIEVRNERLSDLFIVLWQYLANGSLLWIITVGIAMSVSMGQEEARAAVLQYGVERATLHVAATGSIVGVLLGLGFFVAPIIRLPFIAYLIYAASVSLLAARWHYESYGIEGMAWMVVGVIMPILLLLIASAMIARDRQQRRLITKES